MGKSFNPFKMWGSYVGATIFFIIAFSFLNAYANVFGGSFNIFRNFFSILLAFFILVIGFLIGWGIHSLVRALRK